ncbi:hypothetical protein B0H19DRAFT_1133357 [Mycena capillaripes]|nr:hypothetical protein B0H19DRAFT_1133357 [Mycena capillaripes]
MGPSNFSQDPIGPTPGTQQMAIGSAFPWDRPIDAPVTNITGGTFIDGNVIQRHGEAGLHILHRAIAGDAFHDSAERYPQPRCHPETRTKLLDVLGSWARGVEPPSNWTDDPEALESSIRPKASRMRPRLLFSSKMFSENNSNDGDSVYSSSRSSSEDDEEEDESLRSSQDENISLGAETSSSGILWLHGPAGSGKSAIAQSFCERLQEQGLLGGSFFFKRGDPSRGSAKKIFPTLAYQLAIRLPEIRQLISQTVENDPAIVDRSLSTQLQELIIEPCRRSSVYFRLTIVIDGLDECDGQNIQAEVLRSIGNAVYQGNLPVLFFIASRPESHICETFSGPSLADLHRPLNITQSFEDIRTYFVDEFGRIYREHRTTMAKVPFPWPTSGILDGLVNKSSGYFIYASTVIKFVDDKQFRPVERLDIILGIKNSISTAPFDPLDQLYHQILSGVPTELRPQLLGILAVIASNLRAELTIEGIEQLLELETGDVRLILQRLHSVIGIPEDDGYPHLWVYHASFIDFLDSPLRSAEFCVRSSQSRTNLACQILKVFSLLDHSLDITRELAKPISFLGSPNAFRWITSADPSPDLLPLVLSLNPDFVFDNVNKQDAGMVMLDWLKKFNPVPEELIQLWHEYTFMALCNQAWTGTQWTNEQPSDIIHNILAQTSSQLIRILTAYRLLAVDRHYIVGNLFRIHVFLGVSWEELRAAICPLRNLLGDDEARLRQVVKAVTSGRSFGQVNSNSLFLALAKGSLRFTQVEKDRETPPRGWLMNMATGWGHFLRSCPPSPDLLQEAGKFEFKGVYHSDGAIKDYHNAIQWLKVTL